MSKQGSVFSMGGGGTNFEQYVQTAFLATLVVKGNAPCVISPNEITEVAFQVTNRGYATDDIMVTATSKLGNHRLLVQVKHNLSFTTKDDTTKEVFKALWLDYSNTTLFNEELDKLVVIKSLLTKSEKSHLITVLSWAKTHATLEDFMSEVKREKSKENITALFHSLLKEANNGIEVSDEGLWKFLKVFCVLEYDFLSQSSVDETYFHNLLRLAKSATSTHSEKNIWDALLTTVTKLNKDGGSMTSATIPIDIKRDFDLTRLDSCYSALVKLRKDSQIILDQLNNTIGKGANQLHIARPIVNREIADSIKLFGITIVTGVAGAGKSVSVKDTINIVFESASCFAFRADQFNQPHLANVLSAQGINESVADIFSAVALIPEKIIVIDSMEKLLEDVDPNNAFKQLCTLISEYPDIKIVGTARKYSVDLILQKFGFTSSDLKVIQIDPLSDEELKTVEIKFPVFTSLFGNEKIKLLLRSPKYLDFALSALSKSGEDYSALSLIEFKNKLWNALIEDITTRRSGLAMKRRKAFLNIAISRAKKMTLFVEPENDIDDAALEALMNDEVIFSNAELTGYSPSHDILEDWALVKYVQKVYQEQSANSTDFFTNLGNEPAIRRAFRLWLEDYLLDSDERIHDLLRQTLTSTNIDSYWIDEVLTAIFKSNDCGEFFKVFKDELLKDDASFLVRCIHITRTTCKESNSSATDILLLLPTGSGWKEIFLFISENVELLDCHRSLITKLLSDWSYILMLHLSSSQEELAVKSIVLHYLKQIASVDDFWMIDESEQRTNTVITILFHLAHVSQTEILQLVKTSQTSLESNVDLRLKKFHKQVVRLCLSGLAPQSLAKAMPDIVMQTAWQHWKLNKPAPSPESSRGLSSYTYQLRDDECWGIKDKSDFFPSGVYKTPLHNLLRFHPWKALRFVVDWMNYSIDFYQSSDCDYKHSFEQIDLKFADGTIVKQWAGWELWAAYRGLSVTHYFLESLLMTLEKFLLEFAALQIDGSRKALNAMIEYLLRNSNNVSVASVIASVAMAYPREVDKSILPLFAIREFYNWDVNRMLQESGTYMLAPLDNEIPFAQEERARLNQLPHRKKYSHGFLTFVVDFQFNIRKYNSEIFAIWDELKANADPADVIWKKRLNELDIRSYQYGEYDAKHGGFPVQPKYDPDVMDFLASNVDSVTAQNVTAKHASAIYSAVKNDAEMTLENWTQGFDHYQSEENHNYLYDRPVGLAVLGLTKLISEISEVHKAWSINTLKSTILTIVNDAIEHNYDIRSYNLLEKDTALHSLHLLKGNIPDSELVSLLVRLFIANLSDHEVTEMLKYARKILNQECPEILGRTWQSLIKYSKYRRTKPNYYPNEDDQNKFKEENLAIIDRLAREVIIDLQVSEYTFENCEPYILVRAFAITPYSSSIDVANQFIKNITQLTIADLHEEKAYGYRRQDDARVLQFNETLTVETYLIDLFLNGAIDLSKEISQILLDVQLDQKRSHYVDRDLTRFVTEPFKGVIYLLDTELANSTDQPYKARIIEKFWIFWNHFFQTLKKTPRTQLIPTLLLDIEWRLESTHWQPLENKKQMYLQMCSEIGGKNLFSVIRVLSTVGDRTTLPEGLLLINNILRNDPAQRMATVTISGERLIKRLFHNHIVEIKNSKNLIGEFIWLLNIMVDLGSSQAYLFRENVITYKNRI